MLAFCFSLVLVALFYLLLLKLKWKRAHSVSFRRSKHETKKTSLVEKIERQQTCRKSSFPAPVPNLGCDIEEPMDWTDSSGATRITLTLTTSNSNASSSRAISRTRNYIYRSTMMSTKIRSNASLSRGIVKCNLVHKSLRTWPLD